ncbi:histidine-rich glycoprotein-like isoform X2 [Candoia aspera]|uniref:histidine-rich glycoprotein-like isoform X2 n=1 Tax=Candoia aspera TaxID=51853 RepID=UPI002FD83C1D
MWQGSRQLVQDPRGQFYKSTNIHSSIYLHPSGTDFLVSAEKNLIWWLRGSVHCIMKLLAGALFIVAWTAYCTPSQVLMVPEDCNDAKMVENAKVTLILINKRRKEGYTFGFYRLVGAYVQQLKNASMVYLTMDVLEMPCPVISRRHWSSCGHRPFLSITDLGQCKAVVYIDELSKRKELYAYNCTVSPVPPKIYECKHCPVRITVLEDTDKHTEEANKILEKYTLGSNESNYFKVEKVQKVFSAVADRTVFIVEFTIKETKCSRNIHPTNVSKCEFQPDGKANLGFCTGRIVKETEAPDVVVVDSCEIYDIQNGSIVHHHHHHFQHDSGEGHHHFNVTGHKCRYPLYRHHHYHHHHPHRHRHHPHHNHNHHHGHIHECRYPPILGRYQTGPAGPRSNHNSSEQTQEGHRDFPPPPGPRYPPPPPGGPHHLPPSKYPPPPLGPPPPRPIPHRPDDHCQLPHRWVPKCGHWHHYHHHHHRSNDTAYKREESGSSEEQDSFSNYHSFHHSSVDLVHRIPILNEHEVLQAPGANFLDHPLPDQGKHEKHTIQPFPEGSSGSKSCPGKPEYDLNPTFLSLFPTLSTQ